MRALLLSILLSLIAAGIGYVFWQQELKYSLPAPRPDDYREVRLLEEVSVRTWLPATAPDRPLLLHFFNPACPCSRFNTRHFKELVQKHADSLEFIAVVPAPELIAEARAYLPEGLRVVADPDEQLARACGVYATPQAALITADNELYYRGNYNKARYCTQAPTNYAALAIQDLLAGRPPKVFGLLASQSYGCSLDERGLGFNPFQ